MKIAVTTPNGNVGSRVTQLLVQGGHTPTVLLRDASKLGPELSKRVEAVEVDLRDRDAVLRATHGVDALFWVDPPNFDLDPIATYAEFGGNAAAAIQHNGIARTVFQSSVGAEARGGFGEIDGLARTEELLNATGASVIHLRCGYFFTNLLMNLDQMQGGSLPTTVPLDQALPWVDPRDIGEVAAALLTNDSWSGQHTRAVHGPEDLTFRRVAEIVSAVVGRAVEAVEIRDDDVRSELRAAGFGDVLVEAIVGMSVGTRDPSFHPENQRDFMTTTPTSLASWAQVNLRPHFAAR